jgi:hypothetical protein
MTDPEPSVWVSCFRCDRIHSRDEIKRDCLYAPSSLSPEADAVVRALAPLFEPVEPAMVLGGDLEDHRNG